MFQFGFVVEQLLGHVTHYQNLKYWVEQDATISPSWMPIAATKNIWSTLPFVGSNWSLQASLRAREAIHKVRQERSLDALFLHTQTTALFAIPLMRQIPTVISVDATPLNYDTVGAGYQHRASGNSWVDRRKFLWNQKTFEAATAIATWCDWGKQSLITDYGIPANKVIIIPPGIDLDQWQMNPDSSQIPGEPIRLLFVGGDFIRKGGETLLQAFCTTLHQSCVLDIVTKSVGVEQTLAGIEGVQVYCGLTRNDATLQKLYAQADIFVFPTQADCYPLAIMEAMASGLPIIATDVGAIREQVETGVNGLLIPVSDAKALVTAVNELVSDPIKRQSMAIASRRLATEWFDGQRNYGKLISLMKQLAVQFPNPERSLPSLSFTSRS